MRRTKKHGKGMQLMYRNNFLQQTGLPQLEEVKTFD